MFYKWILMNSLFNLGRIAVPKMLQKRDSKSLEGVMRSVLLTERLKNALQDNKSQSLDEGIFNEKDEKSRAKNGDDGDDSPEGAHGTEAAEVGTI